MILPSRICLMIVGLFFWGVARCSGEPAGQKTYCNPVDINYQYDPEQKSKHISYRSGADPVIVNHQGEYYLFVTASGGWWRSKDLVDWHHVKPNVSPYEWPKEDMCAPAALSVGGKLYLFQSTFDRRPIYVTTTPASGRLSFFNPLLPYLPGAAGPWDPAIFHDDDTDRWFMYFGSSNLYPIYGIELDYTNQLNYLGTAVELIALQPERHGWERFGRGHTCLELGLASALVPVVVGAIFLRGALPVGSRWVAAALGAGGGCLGGLVLHLHCNVADGLHVGLIHGGVVVLSALLSAAIVPRATDPR